MILNFRHWDYRGFSFLELMISFGIVFVLGILTISYINRAKICAQNVQCASRLQQLSLAIQVYTQENQGALPYPSRNFSGGSTSDDRKLCWFNAIDPYLVNSDAAAENQEEKILEAKQDPIFNQFSSNWKSSAHTYKMNERLGEDSQGNKRFYRLHEIAQPGLTVLLFDGRAENDRLKSGAPALIAKNPQGTEGMVARRHQGKANVLFVDGHIETREEKPQSGNGLGWAIDKTSLIWKPWLTTEASNQMQ